MRTTFIQTASAMVLSVVFVRFVSGRCLSKRINSFASVSHHRKGISSSSEIPTQVFPWTPVLPSEHDDDVQLPAALFRDTSFKNFDFAPVHEVKEGATAAFEAAVESMFQQPNIVDTLRPFELFSEKRLAEFMKVKKGSALIEHDTFYKLQEIVHTKIIDAELIIGTSRKTITSSGSYISGNGLTFVRCFPNPPQNQVESTVDEKSKESVTIATENTQPLMTASDFTSLDSNSSDNDCCTLRYTVEFLCKGTSMYA